MTSKKRLVILGSTGSVGSQCLDVIRKQSENFDVVALMADKNIDLLSNQINEFKPSFVLLGENGKKNAGISKLTSQSILLYSGISDFTSILKKVRIDLVINALPSLLGFRYSYECLKKGVNLALANKESILLLGDQLMELSKENDAEIIPIDSEASAVYQCLLGEKSNSISKVYLTASGGPLYKRNSSVPIDRGDVLNHPVWKMGPKISVDSATMMNKAFEVYELHKLFDIPMEKIEVVIHPESHVHSMVEFVDGNIKALVSSPDMKVPIHYALHHPERIEHKTTGISIPGLWSFDTLSDNDFPCFHLAMKYLKKGKSFPAALCIVNDTLVDSFLDERIHFTDIFPLLSEIMSTVDEKEISDLDGLSDFVKECKELCLLKLK